MRDETKQMVKEYSEGAWDSPITYIRECRRYIDLEIFDEFIIFINKSKVRRVYKRKTKNIPIYNISFLRDSLIKKIER